MRTAAPSSNTLISTRVSPSAQPFRAAYTVIVWSVHAASAASSSSWGSGPASAPPTVGVRSLTKA